MKLVDCRKYLKYDRTRNPKTKKVEKDASKCVVGVYALFNRRLNEVYIGSTDRMYSRMNTHKTQIAAGSFDSYSHWVGDLNDIEFGIIKEYPGWNNAQLEQKEMAFIAEARRLNIMRVVNNPDATPRTPIIALGLTAGPSWFESVCDAARELGVVRSCISAASRGEYNKNGMNPGTHRYKGFEFYTEALYAARQIVAPQQQSLFFGLSGCAES